MHRFHLFAEAKISHEMFGEQRGYYSNVPGASWFLGFVCLPFGFLGFCFFLGILGASPTLGIQIPS